MADQLNYNNFTYLDDNARSWNVRGEDNAILTAVNGATAAGGNPHFPRNSRKFHTRKIIYVDNVTFRTKTVIFYTPTAYAAITLGTSTLSIHVPGNVAPVVYTASQKVGEKQPGTRPVRQLVDHA